MEKAKVKRSFEVLSSTAIVYNSVVQLPLLTTHLTLQWFCSKLQEMRAGSSGGTKVQRLLSRTISRTRVNWVGRGF